MYDKSVSMLALTPDGTLSAVIADANSSDILQALYGVIGTRAVQRMSLPRNVDLWLDEEGLLVEQPDPNLYGAAVIAAYSHELAGSIVFGTVVLAGVRRAATVSLDEHNRESITELVVALNGRVAPTMRPVPMNSGRAWEWVYAGVRYRAESDNGSPVVRLKYHTNAQDSEWTISVERDTNGRSAKLVAEEMFRDTTGGVA